MLIKSHHNTVGCKRKEKQKVNDLDHKTLKDSHYMWGYKEFNKYDYVNARQYALTIINMRSIMMNRCHLRGGSVILLIIIAAIPKVTKFNVLNPYNIFYLKL